MTIDNTNVGAEESAALDKVTKGFRATRDDGINFTKQMLLAVFGEMFIDFEKAGLAAVIENDDGFDHCCF